MADAENAPVVLDRIDQAILNVLRRDGRITFQKLSEEVHLTARPCLERVRRLEKRGIICGYSAIVDQKKLAPGFLSLLVLVALSSHSGRAAQKAFEARMIACPQVLSCCLISGAFDYSLRMRCRDMEHYRLLTEEWFNDAELQVDKLVSHPELSMVKTIGP